MAKKKESYEDKMERLEKVVAHMESSELTLDESIAKYEEGVNLYKELSKLLQEAEGRIKLLNDNGEVDFAQE